MKINKKHKEKVFQTPQNYFEDFEKRLHTELKFQELFPVKGDGFTVPDGYFEEVELRLIKNTAATSKVIKPNFKAFAAAVTTIAAVFALLFYAIKPNNYSTDFDSISLSNLENYLYDQDRFQDYLSYEELTHIEENTSIFDDETLSDDLIYDYVDQDIITNSLEEGQ